MVWSIAGTIAMVSAQLLSHLVEQDSAACKWIAWAFVIAGGLTQVFAAAIQVRWVRRNTILPTSTAPHVS
eukprot:CAMPEP_0174861490 /NCGR_PEP_ID=MMETSP1114-20130205/51767_1 /TAXON_ID=312471 /ORGANISM="Neobodo designis, Strain CCAP 1951/1" /LENGTH=69 /DNA_ID=CAMNT_0016096503 /DNA_START=11 /DNA_END=220 /DNA_ORIENTATION=+